MLSFGFAGEPVTISIETREERGEACSSLAGFFRQYDLIYVVGDEHDLFGVRTNHRRPEEQVYLYRTRSRHEKRPAPVPRPSGRNATARRPRLFATYSASPAAAVDPLCKAKGFAWRRQLGRERLAARSEQTLHLQAAWQPVHQGLIAVPVALVAAC